MSFDVVVVGAGIVGLGHAYHAVRRGKSVCVVERADRPVGASVRNFGHASISAQSGRALEYGHAAKEHWMRLARDADFWLRESGTFLACRTDAELAVVDDFARGIVLGPDEFAARSGARTTLGGGFFAGDLQVDPRTAAPAIADYLARSGVEFRWRTIAFDAADGVLHTSRDDVFGDAIVYAVNHDVARQFPAVADNRIRDCALHMLQVSTPVTLAGPILTGWSLLRYSGLSTLPGIDVVRDELSTRLPEGAALDLHVMATPQPDGTVVLGDTHVRENFAGPFQSERGYELLLTEFADAIGTAVDDIRVLQRWQGVYASASDSEYLVAEVRPGVHVTAVTTGIGMTTGLGFTEAFADRYL